MGLRGTRPGQGLNAEVGRSRPDSRCPPPKNLVRASSVISGLVNMKTISTSISVVSPRVKAKPFTEPMAKTNNTMAESMDTASAISTVCRARRQPVSTAVRRLRPSRTSSRIRSKKITKLSA